ncbi:MAG: hypothetical protein JSV24_11340, partial [Bacteroidales bacterium]
FFAVMPSLALSIITIGISTLFFLIPAYILGSVEKFSQDIGDLIGCLSYVIITVIACFFICRGHPKSVWYVPFICNIVSIAGAFGPEFWVAPTWMIVCGGWVLSLIGAISGALIGRHAARRAIT